MSTACRADKDNNNDDDDDTKDNVQGCVCESGYTINRAGGNIGCRQVAGTNLYYLIFASAILLILLPLIIVLAWPQLRARWVTLKDRWWSKSGAPGKSLLVAAKSIVASSQPEIPQIPASLLSGASSG